MIPQVGGVAPRLQRGMGMRTEAESQVARQTLNAVQDSLEPAVPRTDVRQQVAAGAEAAAGIGHAVGGIAVADAEIAAGLVSKIPGGSFLAGKVARSIGPKAATMMVAWFAWASLVAVAEWTLKVVGIVLATSVLLALKQARNLGHWTYRFCYPDLEWQVKLHCAIALSEREAPPAHGLLKEQRLEALAKRHTFGGSGTLLAGALNAEYLTRGRRSLTTTRRTIVPELCKVDVLPVHAKAHKNKAYANMLFAAGLQEDALPFALAALRKNPLNEPALWNAYCDASIACANVNALRWAVRAPGLPEARRQDITTALATHTKAAPALQPQGV